MPGPKALEVRVDGQLTRMFVGKAECGEDIPDCVPKVGQQMTDDRIIMLCEV
jgi:hypothetical protein